VIVVSNSSPLITLDKIGRLDLLRQLFGAISNPQAVYAEVVISGAGLAGAASTAAAKWIRTETFPADRQTATESNFGLGAGELSAISLAQTINADLVLLDDFQARALARKEGLNVTGCIGVLERAYLRSLLTDLDQAYRQLLSAGAYIGRKLLGESLQKFNLPPL
jgi:predicted nucleic acid-binding protein